MSKVKQTGFLELTAPDGAAINVQFIDTTMSAESEFAQTGDSMTGFGPPRG
ncbi:MAG: hypothetical protein M3O28_01110 [Actinomycetota bacterium]|nr:hypothetical protein [Actinomycetota bacterium]